MAILTLIMGDSGTGKSTSIRTLDSKETVIINVLNKPLPFKGYKNNYKNGIKDGGNYFSTDNADHIILSLKYISENRPEIKNIIIDDFQYIMANEYMRRAKERGYDKFTDIACNAWKVIKESSELRDDLFVFVLTHTETDQFGKVRSKTIGKMIDSTIVFEGMFVCVLHSTVTDNNYEFLTQNNGNYIAKSPMGMFSMLSIPNDLQSIKEKMIKYSEND